MQKMTVSEKKNVVSVLWFCVIMTLMAGLGILLTGGCTVSDVGSFTSLYTNVTQIGTDVQQVLAILQSLMGS